MRAGDVQEPVFVRQTGYTVVWSAASRGRARKEQTE